MNNTLYYPNRWMWACLQATHDVMGQSGMGMVLSLANLEHLLHTPPPDNMAKQIPFEALAEFMVALETVYGTRGGRGMAQQIGRATFALGLKDFGALAGVSDPAFRLKPLEEQARIGLRGLAHVFTHFSDQEAHVEVDEQAFTFVVPQCACAWGRASDRPVCYWMIGLIQECLRWATNDHAYAVHETECGACGDQGCRFVIDKQPLA